MNKKLLTGIAVMAAMTMVTSCGKKEVKPTPAPVVSTPVAEVGYKMQGYESSGLAITTTEAVVNEALSSEKTTVVNAKVDDIEYGYEVDLINTSDDAEVNDIAKAFAETYGVTGLKGAAPEITEYDGIKSVAYGDEVIRVAINKFGDASTVEYIKTSDDVTGVESDAVVEITENVRNYFGLDIINDGLLKPEIDKFFADGAKQEIVLSISSADDKKELHISLLKSSEGGPGHVSFSYTINGISGSTGEVEAVESGNAVEGTSEVATEGSDVATDGTVPADGVAPTEGTTPVE